MNDSEFFCVIQGFQQTGLIFQPYCYRTGAGEEIDLIIESYKGILSIEIKFTQTIIKMDSLVLSFENNSNESSLETDEIYEHSKISSKKETLRSVGSYIIAKELNG